MSVQETNLIGRVKGKEKHLSEQETMPFFLFKTEFRHKSRVIENISQVHIGPNLPLLDKRC